MRFRCNWPGSFGRLLAGRLDELRRTLDTLGGRLRGVESDAVGQTISTVVSAAVNRALDRLSGPPAEDDFPPSRPLGWDETGSLDQEDLGPADPDLWPDDRWEDGEPEPRREDPRDRPSESRLAAGVSAGLTAAAWVLRGWAGRYGLASAGAVGLCAGCAAYAAPALVGAGTRLLVSVRHARALGDAARSLVSA